MASVSRELGVNEGLIHKWKRAILDNGDGHQTGTQLSEAAALKKRNAIIHTDQGSQYAAVKYRRLLYVGGFRQSMSRKGNYYDNAQAESFFSHFKAELVEGGIFESVEDAQSEVFSYIEGYYNRIRLHSGLGYKSPLEFEKELKIKNIRSSESFVS